MMAPESSSPSRRTFGGGIRESHQNHHRLFWTVPGLTLGIFTGAIICLLLNDPTVPVMTTDLSQSPFQRPNGLPLQESGNQSSVQSLNEISIDELFKKAADQLSHSDLAMREKQNDEDDDIVVHFGHGLGGAIRAEEYPDVMLARQDGYKPREELRALDGSEFNDDGNSDDNRLLYIHTSMRSADDIHSVEMLMKSLLVTQNLQFAKFIVWMNNEEWLTSNDPYKVNVINTYRYTPYQFVQFRKVNLQRLAQSLAESCGSSVPSLSYDLLQIAVLSSYGGLWLNPDSVVLKDLTIAQTNQHKVGTNQLNENVPPNFVYAFGESHRRQLKTFSCDSLKPKDDSPSVLFSTTSILTQCRDSDSCNFVELPTPNLSETTLGGGMPIIPCHPFIDPEILWKIPDDTSVNWETSIVAITIPVGIESERLCGKVNRTALDSLRSSIVILMDEVIGRDVRLAPVEPMNWLTVDLWPYKPSYDEEVEFSIMTIFTLSHASNFNNRQLMRSQLKTRGWRLKETTKERDFKIRLLFIVHLLNETESYHTEMNAQIRWESLKYRDVMVLPPSDEQIMKGERISTEHEMGHRIAIETSSRSTTSTTTSRTAEQSTSTTTTTTTGSLKTTPTSPTTPMTSTTTTTTTSTTTTTKTKSRGVENASDAIQSGMSQVSPSATGMSQVSPAAMGMSQVSTAATSEDDFVVITQGPTVTTMGGQELIASVEGETVIEEIEQEEKTVKEKYVGAQGEGESMSQQMSQQTEPEEVDGSRRRLLARDFFGENDRIKTHKKIDARSRLIKSEEVLNMFESANMELGSLPRSIQTAVVKWSGHAESRYLLFLYTDTLFINLFAFQDFLGDLAEGYLFRKTRDTISVAVAFRKIDHENAVPLDITQPLVRRFPTADEKEEGKVIFDLIDPSTIKLVKPSDLHSPDKFNGLLVTRDVVKHLLSPEHPIRLGGTIQHMSECHDPPPSPSSLPSPLPTVSYGTNITLEDICFTGYNHPINHRLKHNLEMFVTKKRVFVDGGNGKHRIRTHFPESFNYTSIAFSQISTPFISVLPSIARTPNCLPSLLPTLPAHDPKAAYRLMRTLRSTLIISDVPCVTAVNALGTFSRIPYGIKAKS